jgi:hypothetical protein
MRRSFCRPRKPTHVITICYCPLNHLPRNGRAQGLDHGRGPHGRGEDRCWPTPSRRAACHRKRGRRRRRFVWASSRLDLGIGRQPLWNSRVGTSGRLYGRRGMFQGVRLHSGPVDSSLSALSVLASGSRGLSATPPGTPRPTPRSRSSTVSSRRVPSPEPRISRPRPTARLSAPKPSRRFNGYSRSRSSGADGAVANRSHASKAALHVATRLAGQPALRGYRSRELAEPSCHADRQKLQRS